MRSPISIFRPAALAALAVMLAGCVVEPLPPEGAPVAYDGCCYAYPEYYGAPAYVGIYGGGYGYRGGGYRGGWGGGGWHR